MANYIIPNSQLSGFEELCQIDDNQFNKVIEILQNFPAGEGLESFQKLFKSNIVVAELNTLPATIFSFGGLLAKSEDETKENISSDLANAYHSTLKENNNTIDVEILKFRLTHIFNNSVNIKITYKAFNLLSLNENAFVDSRIITDIRLIFDENISEQNRSAVIIHRLKIECDSEENPKEFYFALDSNDLNKLNLQIQRALQKEEVIKNNYKTTISFIEITD